MIGARRILGPLVGLALAAGVRTAKAADQKVPPPVVEAGPAEFHATTPYPPVPKRSDLAMAAAHLPA
ncbi:MAG TPA: hypothetical protein VFA98_09590, partial [Thermoanaerobaculia bacterium]|nr:hypothetical protein [Thermoanaerobaculia bacterium]